MLSLLRSHCDNVDNLLARFLHTTTIHQTHNNRETDETNVSSRNANADNEQTTAAKHNDDFMFMLSLCYSGRLSANSWDEQHWDDYRLTFCYTQDDNDDEKMSQWTQQPKPNDLQQWFCSLSRNRDSVWNAAEVYSQQSPSHYTHRESGTYMHMLVSIIFAIHICTYYAMFLPPLIVFGGASASLFSALLIKSRLIKQ